MWFVAAMSEGKRRHFSSSNSESSSDILSPSAKQQSITAPWWNGGSSRTTARLKRLWLKYEMADRLQCLPRAALFVRNFKGALDLVIIT